MGPLSSNVNDYILRSDDRRRNGARPSMYGVDAFVDMLRGGALWLVTANELRYGAAQLCRSLF